MCPQREDYVLRQIRVIAAMLARVAGLRLNGETEQARAALEESYSFLLGSQAEIIRRVDAGTAAKLLGSRDRVLAFVDLLEEEAAQETAESRRALLRERALELSRLAEERGRSSRGGNA